VKEASKAAMVAYILTRCERIGDCMVWTGAHAKAGYGNMKWEGRTYQVHRAMFEATTGQIPKDKWVRHRCDRRDCVRPEHLYLDKRGRKPKG
jgi:hypothetical protein